MSRLLIIGGSDAGISAALRAREVNPAWEVTALVADAYPNFSICGLPFYLSGETPDWRDLAHRTIGEIETQGIRLALNHTARRIDPVRQEVVAETSSGEWITLPYDRLIFATGAEPLPPAISGADLPGVYPLHTMDDGFRLEVRLTALLAGKDTTASLTASSSPPSRPMHERPKALIVGGGYIGLEIADALTQRGFAVTLAQRGASLLTTVDARFGARVAQELARREVNVVTEAAIERITPDPRAPDGLVAHERERKDAFELVIRPRTGGDRGTTSDRARSIRRRSVGRTWRDPCQPGDGDQHSWHRCR